jgi:hypothetical protein
LHHKGGSENHGVQEEKLDFNVWDFPDHSAVPTESSLAILLMLSRTSFLGA